MIPSQKYLTDDIFNFAQITFKFMYNQKMTFIMFVIIKICICKYVFYNVVSIKVFICKMGQILPRFGWAVSFGQRLFVLSNSKLGKSWSVSNQMDIFL